MGTRHLIAVVLDGEYKIAQYGQWDGYPSGQGVSVLSFLNNLIEHEAVSVFKNQLKRTSFLTDAEIEEFDNATTEKLKEDKNYDWTSAFPHLSRDAGAKILQMVLLADESLKLKNSIDFALDSLFCEYAYIIDLDTMKLEVYKGFNKKRVANGRFKSKDVPKRSDGANPEYTCVRLYKTFDLNNLPTREEFLKALSKI